MSVKEGRLIYENIKSIIPFMFQSSDKTSGTNTHFHLTLSEEIKHVMSVQIASVTIPCTYYYINKGNIYLGTNSNDITVSIIPGSYSPTTLASTLQSTINSTLSITCTVVWNAITQKYTITHSSGAESIFIDSTLGLANLLGFSSNTTITTGNSATSDFKVDISSINIVGDSTVFNLSDGKVDYPITVSEKSYTASSLAAELQIKINAHASLSDFVVVFNPNTFKYVITSGGGFGDPVIGSNSKFILADIMGFETNSVGSSNVITATYQTLENLNFSNFYITSSLIRKNQQLGFINKTLGEEKLIRIPIRVLPGEILTFVPEERISIKFGKFSGIDLSEIDFKLYFADEYNVREPYLAYLNGWPWSIKLLIEQI
jgi:hypothetical protein